MKKIVFLVFTFISLMMVFESSAQRKKKNNLETELDSVSYAFGISLANTVQQQDIPGINIQLISKGLVDRLGEEETKLTFEESSALLNEYLTALYEKRDMEKLEKMAKFLDDNKKDSAVVTLKSGLQYKIIKEGEGPSPKSTSTVKAHYKGSLINGNVFESSYDNEPIEFNVKQVIRGWQEALVLMKPGAKWMLYIPPYLGYGERAAGSIPPNSILIFEIDLISFK